MKKQTISALLFAVLAALILAGCGNVTPTSSTPEVIATFGTLEPSAVPSTNEIKPETSSNIAVPSAKPTDGDDDMRIVHTSSQPVSPSPTHTPAPSSAATAKPTVKPSATAQPSASPSVDPYEPSPPKPQSTAEPKDAEKYIGKSAKTMLDEIGFPGGGRDYEDVDENDPSLGEIGTFYYDGFTVITKRMPDGTETVTAVNK